MCFDQVEVVRMNLGSRVSLAPLVESDAEIRERNAVRIQALGLGSHDADKLRREVEYLTELHFLLSNPFVAHFAAEAACLTQWWSVVRHFAFINRQHEDGRAFRTCRRCPRETG